MSAAPTISTNATRHLRAIGHALKPIVQVGKEGITEGILAATQAALLTHELVKVKILSEAPVERHAAAQALADGTNAHLAQVLGRVALLYKRHPNKPKIVLPKK
jgi:RNA-binding protein